MRHVTITVSAPDVKDIQPIVANLIREQWLTALAVDYCRLSEDSISVTDRTWTWLAISNQDPYITLTATR